MKRLTARERALIESLTTPRAVQRWLRASRYNHEPNGETLRGFRGVVRHRTAHCLEAALFAATVLEQHGYPPTVISFESQDGLDHVLYVFREHITHGAFGAVARSRDEGLHGRAPVFRGPRELVRSYADPYVDDSGRILGYAIVDLRELGNYDWRLGEGNLWKVERFLIDYPHIRLPMGDARYERLLRRYRAFRAVGRAAALLFAHAPLVVAGLVRLFFTPRRKCLTNPTSRTRRQRMITSVTWLALDLQWCRRHEPLHSWS